MLRRLRGKSAAAEDAAEEPDEARAESTETGKTPAAEAPARRLHLRNARFVAWLGKPLTSFHLVIAIAGLLITLGLIMVLSASGVKSYDIDGTPWLIFGKQVMWTVIGLFAFWIALRMPVGFIRRASLPFFCFTILLLILVLIPGIGTLSNGSRGWFVVGPMSMQPSELAKVAFAIWGAHLLATRRTKHASLRQMLIPLIPAAAIACTLIVAQPDLGQTVSMAIILIGLLWFAGLPLKVFVTSLGAMVSLAAVMALSAGYRSTRVRSWLDPSSDAQGAGYQARQSKFALANGGVFGEGLGQGTAKYNYLPNAHNDFIFAIVGEELGFIGALGLLLLFALFAYTGLRIARRSVDPFLRLLTATTTLWIIGQSFINVGYVLGLLPVTGLQLPLISAGGTSTATTLVMIGLMANAARHEPEAVAALRAGRDDRMNRFLRLPLPVPYDPKLLDSGKPKARPKPAPAAKPVKPAKAVAKAPARRPAKTPPPGARRRPAPERGETRSSTRRGVAERQGRPERSAERREPARRDPARREPARRDPSRREPARAQTRTGKAASARSAKVGSTGTGRAQRAGGARDYGDLPPAGLRQPRGRRTLEGQRYG